MSYRPMSTASERICVLGQLRKVGAIGKHIIKRLFRSRHVWSSFSSPSQDSINFPEDFSQYESGTQVKVILDVSNVNVDVRRMIILPTILCRGRWSAGCWITTQRCGRQPWSSWRVICCLHRWWKSLNFTRSYSTPWPTSTAKPTAPWSTSCSLRTSHPSWTSRMTATHKRYRAKARTLCVLSCFYKLPRHLSVCDAFLWAELRWSQTDPPDRTTTPEFSLIFFLST